MPHAVPDIVPFEWNDLKTRWEEHPTPRHFVEAPRRFAPPLGLGHLNPFRATIPGVEPSKSDDRHPADDRESAYDLFQRGHALLEQRHFAQAAIVLERANRVEPGKGSILEGLGRAYFNSGQAERACATFEALLEIDPSSHYAHYALGQCLKRLGKIDGARTHLKLAVALSPDHPLYSAALRRLPPARGRKSTDAGRVTHDGERPTADDSA